MPFSRGNLCQFGSTLVHSFSKYNVHKLVTDEETDRRTLCVEIGVRIKTVYVGCGYCVRVFYHAERVLSTIAKFLVYLLGEGEG